MKSKILSKIVIVSAIFLPLITSAQLTQTRNLFEKVRDLVGNVLIPLVFTLALLLFFWGVVKYIWSEGQGKAEGKKIMVWGIIALFVMSSVWGLVRLLRTELDIGDIDTVKTPNIQY